MKIDMIITNEQYIELQLAIKDKIKLKEEKNYKDGLNDLTDLLDKLSKFRMDEDTEVD